MTKVLLEYNPFTVESKISINGSEISGVSKLSNFQFERLQMWLEQLFPALLEECNDDLNLTFHGTDLDFEDLKDCLDNFLKSNPRAVIQLEHIPSKASGDRIRELIELFDYMQKECPFEDLRDKQIRENFSQAIGSEFEVSVIATMSSGKSTLINSMLGCELMPAKNEACTATIARIKDVDGKEGFSAICRDTDNNTILEEPKLTLEAMEQFNNDPQVAYIDVEGDIPFLSSKEVSLVLLDTPGPNNSRTEEHKNQTYRIIKERSKPMVLYVLNATQLSTNDDNFLLSAVADAMKVGGKQAKDRFIFAVNKCDTFDTDKGESIDSTLRNVRDYLAQHGIENPNIYPTSAEMAKVIRLSKSGYALSKKQRQTKDSYWLFNEDSQMHLSKYAPLSTHGRALLEQRIQDARAAEDDLSETLIHTGIPAIEVAINEYLDKYAVTAKVKTAVDTFNKKIEDKQLVANLANELKGNEKAREELNNRLKFVQKQLDDGKKAGQFRKKIQEISLTTEADQKLRKVRAKVETVLQEHRPQNSKMTSLEAEQFMRSLMRACDDLRSDAKTDLENIVEESVVKGAQTLLGEYESYIQSLLQDNTLESVSFQSNVQVKMLLGDVPNATQLIQQFKQEESVCIGERYVKNTNKRWYKPWTWLQEKGHYEDIYERREYVDSDKIFDEFVQPVKGNFEENLEGAKSAAYAEAEKFKRFFMKELDRLDKAMKAKISELEQLCEDQKSIGRKIEEDREKIQWLNAFSSKLDMILKI